jgi:hypothetical protein
MKATSMHKLGILGVLAVLALVAGCDKKAQAPATAPTTTSTAPSPSSAPAGVSVTSVTLGNAIGAQKKVTQPSNSFARNDTIYASVDTAGSGTATLNAKWTYRANGQDVSVREDTQTVNTTGPATSEFHVSKPDGWPTGDYEVEILVDGKSAGTRKMTVK